MSKKWLGKIRQYSTVRSVGQPIAVGRRQFIASMIGGALSGALLDGCRFADVTDAGSYQGCWLNESRVSSHELSSLADTQTTTLGLNARARVRSLVYGAAVDETLFDDDGFAALVAAQCGMLVPENALKWYALRPDPDTFNFALADAIFDFGAAHGMIMRAHTLLWHLGGGGLPSWIASLTPQNAPRIVAEHIATVVGRYAGRVHSWDVVNEGIAVEDGRADGLRDSPWLRLLGSDYIAEAYRMARAADPSALLVYNDYGLEYATQEDQAKRRAVLDLLSRLKDADVPIHGLGMQSHLRADETRFDPCVLLRFLEEIEALGLKVLVTELDVDDSMLSADLAGRDEIVAAHYRGYLETVLQSTALVAVLTWGLSDRYTWLGSTARPLPFDRDLSPKPAWFAIGDALSEG